MRNKHKLNHFISAVCLIIFIILSYSLLLGRGSAIPEKIEYTKVRNIVLTYQDKTRVLRGMDINAMDDLLKGLAKVELKPGLAPVTPDPQLATMTIWYTRGKYENQYIFMEHSVMQSQGLMIPRQYRLIDDHGLMEMIRKLVMADDTATASGM